VLPELSVDEFKALKWFAKEEDGPFPGPTIRESRALPNGETRESERTPYPDRFAFLSELPNRFHKAEERILRTLDAKGLILARLADVSENRLPPDPADRNRLLSHTRWFSPTKLDNNNCDWGYILQRIRKLRSQTTSLDRKSQLWLEHQRLRSVHVRVTELGRAALMGRAKKVSHRGKRPTLPAKALAPRQIGTAPEAAGQASEPLNIDFPNPSAPLCLKEAADRWGGQMTRKKLRELMNSGKVRYRKLSRQRFIFCKMDAPNLPDR